MTTTEYLLSEPIATTHFTDACQIVFGEFGHVGIRILKCHSVAVCPDALSFTTVITRIDALKLNNEVKLEPKIVQYGQAMDTNPSDLLHLHFAAQTPTVRRVHDAVAYQSRTVVARLRFALSNLPWRLALVSKPSTRRH